MPDRPNPVDLLKVLARRHRGRLTGLNLHDPNVCTSALDWRDALAHRPPPADHFRHQLKLEHGNRFLTLRSNDRFIAIDAKGTFDSDVLFSINRPNRVMMMPMHVVKQLAPKKWRVFVETGKRVPAPLDHHMTRRTIEIIDLNADESLHVYANGLTVYIQPDSAERVEDVMAAALTLADGLGSTRQPPSTVNEVPKEFDALMPLLARWAKSDDEERTELLTRASRAHLEGLVRQVAPYFRAINKYLDGFNDRPMPECALALGTLAECASEAQILLEQTRSRAVPNRRLQPTAARSGSKKRASRRG